MIPRLLLIVVCFIGGMALGLTAQRVLSRAQDPPPPHAEEERRSSDPTGIDASRFHLTVPPASGQRPPPARAGRWSRANL
jgi:hypothetical protein